ncbi:hypothetical protein [Flavobacterium aquicola]|uniref:Tetratricopeptide repeat protein n=1 Tax=Flavobacterium aquicola TaxID=1682742 RepID=A0A3E0E5T5_9FLAO|nr:hypothetical protein [Flavobacterium aquicola]REG93010.1 hypothetical protein C8P67_114111 [Flavobacterium aquicola]
METIFNYNPSLQELSDIRFDSLSLCLKFAIDIEEELTPAIYKKLISQENAYYDLACLFEFRGDEDKANEYWSKLPENHKTNGLGLDNYIQTS